MKVLWFSHFVPFPPKGGAHQRSFNLLRSCSSLHEVFLIAFNLQGEPHERLEEYASELKKYCEVVEFWPLPVPWKTRRWWAGLAFSPFSPYPYGARTFCSPRLIARWKEILLRHPGALVHYDSLDLALFTNTANGFRKVLNHHNCESQMTYTRARWEPNPFKKGYLWHEARKITSLERAVCHRFDVNITVSELDARRLRRANPRTHIHLVENGTDISYFQPANDAELPRTLIFSGSLNWYPNISAIQFFVREIWPLIKNRCPDVRLYVVGNKPSDSLCRWLKQDSTIFVVPSPEDIRPWIQMSTVVVCPFLDGGGTKVKILDAMAMAKPVVATGKGCEGLRVTHGENILVAENPRDFAHEVIRTLESKPLRRELGAAGRVLVERYYNWEIIGCKLEQAYQCASTNKSCNHQVKGDVSDEMNQPEV